MRTTARIASLVLAVSLAGMFAARLAGQIVRAAPTAPAPLPDFAGQRLSDKYVAEGIGVGDFDRDGKRDVVCGPYWYRGPEFTRRTAIYPPKAFSIWLYADNFFAFGSDISGDGWDDVLVIGFPGTAAHWYENPAGKPVGWRKHTALPSVDGESPAFADLDGDGRPELICSVGRRLGFAQPAAADPRKVWRFRPITPAGPWPRFWHGFGIGDVSGDGRADVLTALGWLEQPTSLVGDPAWRAHPVQFGSGGAQMFAYDVDGDGDNDVISGIAAHGYGLSWFEHIGQATGITFREHVILPRSANAKPLQFSQLHALALADVDGDGLRDIVTGKTFWAHLGNDPGARDPAVLYWFRLRRSVTGALFEPRQIDADSGVGRQVTVVDVSGDGRPDVLVGNKKGVFVFRKN